METILLRFTCHQISTETSLNSDRINSGRDADREWPHLGFAPPSLSCGKLCRSPEIPCSEPKNSLLARRGNGVSGPVTKRVFTTAEGADTHCQLGNLPLSNAVVYDWLDEVFA
jgi:hypothetical protein